MQYKFKTIDQIVDGKYERAVVRVDFNVPLKDGKVENGFRIEETWPTVEALLKKGIKVVLLAHLGDDGAASLRPVAEYLTKFASVKLADTIEYAKELSSGGEKIVLLENVRRFPGEKENSPELGKKLSELGDVFVNEGFPVSHRKHASVIGVAKNLPSYAGLIFEKEVKMLSRAFEPEHPFVLILGGVKAETKTPLIDRFFDIADKIIMGGALANDFLKASGRNVGKSLVSEKDLIKKEWLSNAKIEIPDGVIVQNESGVREVPVSVVGGDDVIVDIGSGFLGKAAETISKAKFVVWNGSFGICEKGFDKGTRGIAEAVIASGCFSIIGGGDTTGAVDAFRLMDKFTFASTGGGAMLDFLGNGTLPGLQALEK